MRGYLSRIGRDERGAILPIAAGALAMMLVLGALVIDVANWYEHGKTLQTRVDASVLAAGQRWAYPCDASVNSNIEATAREFVGSHVRHPGDTLVTAPYNNLITTTDPQDVHVVFNSLQYFGDGGLDYTDRVNPNDAVTGQPCTREYLDAKITEMNIDGFFGKFAGLSFLPSLKKKARVAPFEVESLEGILPIGVKAFDVRSGAVLFVRNDDRNGVPLAKKFFIKDNNADGPDADTTDDLPNFVRWSNEADPTTDLAAAPATGVVVPAAGIGAVIVLSSRPRCDAPGVVPPCLDLTLTRADEICNQGDTECFDKDIPGSPPTQSIRSGLSNIAAYNPSPGTPTATEPPVLGDVYVTPGTALPCRNGAFVYGDAPCTVRVVADVRFAGGVLPAGRPDSEVVLEVYDRLWCPGGCTLSRDVSLGPTRWAGTLTTSALPLTDTDGRNPIRLRWRYGGGNVGGQACANNPTAGNNVCDGGFGPNGVGFVGNHATGAPVHQLFSSNEILSGPIELVRIFRSGGPTNWYSNVIGNASANSYPALASADLMVDVFLSNVVATDPGDPPIALRVTGSQNGSIDCDNNVSLFSEEFANGCRPRYAVLPSGQSCPLYNDLWNTPQPWRCIKTQTGNFLGQFTQGLRDRVYGGANNCPGDNDAVPGNFRRGWNWWNSGLNPAGPPILGGSMFPNFDPTDPRLVTLFVTPFGSFQGSGNAIFPITGFGAFYITGWSATGGDQDNCAGFDTAPTGGFLVGHFIKDVLISGATPSQNKCNPASLTPCVVALVE